MALTAWSAACEASAAGQLQQTAVLMGASGDLWAAHPQPSAATLARQKVGGGWVGWRWVVGVVFQRKLAGGWTARWVGGV